MSTLNPATAGSPSSHDAPARGAVAIDYSGGDQTLATSTRGVFVGGAGALKVDFIDGTTVTLTGLSAGSVYPLCVKKIYQVGSTATNCVALI